VGCGHQRDERIGFGGLCPKRRKNCYTRLDGPAAEHREEHTGETLSSFVLSRVFFLLCRRTRAALLKVHAVAARLLILDHLKIVRTHTKRFEDAVSELDIDMLAIS
jgi:hypothetical protein